MEQRVQRSQFPVVVHTLLRREGTILLLRRSHTGYLDGFFAAPGGHLQRGEGVVEAAVRECREEAGVYLDTHHLRPAVVMPYRSGGHQGVDFVLCCERWRGEARIAEPERFDRLVWASPDALPPNTVPYLALALQLAERGEWFHEYTGP